MATSRSLGTLTIDLIAKIQGFTQGMDAAERKADRTTREMERKAKERAQAIDEAFKAIGIGAAASFAALSLAIIKTTTNANQLANLAALASASTEEFQRLSVAAKLVGIEQDKLGDQLKDFNEKVGEFQETGGGGMKDFFEQIAPKIGITAEAFKGLSGPQALQLYYNSLEKAGVSQERMSFYLESMASDTTALIPILANGGQVLNEMGDAAERAGVIMSGTTVTSAQELAVQVQVLQMQTEGLVTQMVGALLPTLSDLAGEFSTVTVEGSTAAATGEVIAKAFKGVAASAAGAYSATLLLGKALGGVGAILGPGERELSLLEFSNPVLLMQRMRGTFARAGSEEVRQQFRDLGADLEAEALKAADMINRIWEAGTGASESSDFAKRVVELRNQLQAATRSATGSGIGAGKDPEGDKARKAAEKYLETLQGQVFKTQELTAYEKLHNDIKLQGLKLSSDQYDKAVGLATAIDMAAEAERARGATIQRNNALFEQQEKLTAKALEYELQLSAYGMGDAQAQRLQERIRLLQEQQAEMRKIENDRANALAGADSQSAADRVAEQYAQRLEIVRNAQAEELRMFDDFTAQKMEKDQSWILGFQNAVNTYIENSRNVYQAADQAVTSIFGSMEDALVSFVTTGKAGFKDFAASILADLARIAARSALTGLGSSILSGIGGLFGGAGGGVDYSLTGGGSGLGLKFGGFRAAGGTVSPGSLYRVNENGPEMLSIGGADYLMTGNATGYVTPNAALQGSPGGLNLNLNIPVAVDLGGGQTDPAQAAAFSEQLATAVKSTVREEIVRSNMPGGTLWAMRNGRA